MRMRQVMRRRCDRTVVHRQRLLHAGAARRNGDGRCAGAIGAHFRVGARAAAGGHRLRVFFGNIIHFGRRFGRLRLLGDGRRRNCAATHLLVKCACGAFDRAFVVDEADFTGHVVAACCRCAAGAVGGDAATGTGATAADSAAATVIVVVVLIRAVVVIRAGGGARQRRACGVGGCRSW